MITVWISGQEREGVDQGWIAQTMEALRRQGADICVRVHVVADGIDVGLSAGSCPPSPGGRRARPAEQRILDSWEACGIRSAEPNPGRLIQCLKRVEQAI